MGKKRYREKDISKPLTEALGIEDLLVLKVSSGNQYFTVHKRYFSDDKPAYQSQRQPPDPRFQEIRRAETDVLGTHYKQKGHLAPHEPLYPVQRRFRSAQAGLWFSSLSVAWSAESSYRGLAPRNGLLKPENISAYLAEADQRGVLPMFFLELCSGLRKGELIALLWSDLDIEHQTISVSKQAVRVKGGVKMTTPKTATSIRLESITKEAVDLLIAEHEKHPDNPYMFPSPVSGGMRYPDAVNRLNNKILKTLGMEHIRFHDLRHTFATIALQNGVDIRTVSSMLGHADPGFTLRTYTHATRQKQDEAAETVGSFMAQIM